MTELLLQNKADVNSRDDHGFTPIIQAIRNAEVIKLLLANGADINAHGERNTALSQAVGHPESTGAGVVELLLTNGADVAVSGDLVFGYAVAFGSTNDVALLMPCYKNTQDPEAKGVLLGTLGNAMEESRRAMVFTITAAATRFQTNALHKAVTFADEAAVRSLLSAHPNEADKKDFLGWTPLHMAALRGNAPIAEMLLSNRAATDTQDEVGNTPLHWAAFAGHSDVVEVLLRHKANTDVVGSTENTPLDFAIQQRFPSIAAMLITNGAGLNSHKRWGDTPLHIAASREDVEVIKLLLVNGANVNALRGANYRQSSLDIAVTGDSGESVRLLITNGASLQTRMAGEGGTLFHLWSGKGSQSVADQLLLAGCDIDAKDHDCKTPLHNAASPLPAVQWMLDHKANVNAQANDGKTPLHLAVIRGNKAVIQCLLDHGADVNAEDKSGKTPLKVLTEFIKQYERPGFGFQFNEVAKLLEARGAKK